MKKSRKYFICSILFIPLIAFFKTEYSKYLDKEYMELSARTQSVANIFTSNLADWLGKNKPEKILLSDLMPYSWDKVCLFESYASMRDMMSRREKKDYPVLGHYNRLDEYQWGIVFLKQQKIQYVITLDRQIADYIVTEPVFCRERTDAGFTILKNNPHSYDQLTFTSIMK